MIIARLQGGLGNQLFQYAAAKGLASRLNCGFKVENITSLTKDRKRKLALDELHTQYHLATENEVRRFVKLPSLYRHAPSLFSLLSKNIYREPHFHFDHSFTLLQDPVFLDGFFQSPKYFSNVNHDILKEFRIKTELSARIKEKCDELANTNSISVHIRRGDFLNPKAINYHGILDKHYYETALELIKQKAGDHARFYFFSDDINWVSSNLLLPPNSELVSKSTGSAIEDFFLMSNCKHNIIANSSFSWWPAWLNNNDKKIVIAPKNWFVDTSIITTDLIPEEWIRI